MSYGNYPDLTGVKKVLVIKLRHHGDVLLTSPVFSNLRKALPKAEIDALVYNETVPMLEGHLAIRRFLTYDRSWKKKSFWHRLKQEFSLLSKVWKGGYDLAINLTEGDRGAIATFVSRSRIRVGLDPEGDGFIGKRRLFTHLVKVCKTARHTVEKNLDALRRIGIFPLPEERDLFFSIPPESRQSIVERLQESGIQPHEFIALHPVSRWRFKCWPASQVAQLIIQLHNSGKKIVMTASSDPQEMEMVKAILQLVPQVPVLNLAGQISLKELGAVIGLAKCLVCVDSVPLHIASALKVPVVVLFGPSSEHNWGPWRHPGGVVVAQNWSCRPCLMDGCGGSKVSDCLSTLPVETVLKAIEKGL